MWDWRSFYLIVHILAVIIAFGPSFAFPLIGNLSQKNPQHGSFALEVIEAIAKRMTIPLAVIVPLAGTGLIYTSHVDLWKSEWLIISIVLYIAAFFFALLVQLPTEVKALELARAMPPPPAGPPPASAGPGAGEARAPIAGAGGPPPEFQRLIKRLQFGGMYLTLSVVVILVLMIWRPGGAYL